MPTKLDLEIGKVAAVVTTYDRAKMIEAAQTAAEAVKDKDLVKFPDRWYPNVSAKTMGLPDFSDTWHRFWFEAMAEILCQKKQLGLPQLLIYWERDDASDHDMILIRLLRLAADGIETELILDRVRKRLATLHYSKSYTAINEVVRWMSFDRRPLELLRPMADVEVPYSDGDKVGMYIERFTTIGL